MRLSFTSFLMMTFFASLTSCKKDIDVVTEPNIPVKMLSRIIEVDFEGKVSFTTFQ